MNQDNNNKPVYNPTRHKRHHLSSSSSSSLSSSNSSSSFIPSSSTTWDYSPSLAPSRTSDSGPEIKLPMTPESKSSPLMNLNLPLDSRNDTYTTASASARLRRPSNDSVMVARKKISSPDLSRSFASSSSASSTPRNSFSSNNNNNNNANANNANAPRMGSGEIIDLMEREQDAIVLKLMREINQLKEENKILKAQINNNPNIGVSRSSSLSGGACSRRFSSSLVDNDGSCPRKRFSTSSRTGNNNNNNHHHHRFSDVSANSTTLSPFHNYKLDSNPDDSAIVISDNDKIMSPGPNIPRNGKELRNVDASDNKMGKSSDILQSSLEDY
ncbi:hypothetical protein DASC09_027970 [Saccharomycopsis crataegensis]|uniref:Uncharacterized protein n=1 Tax=Saccharomycopsis crataegensis TaxID=43959 RepID=A0AAV5QL10_9ASCO|nr:hypothetical protein DASC09_027970 [Saccharomycopsis crataegensis]